MFFFFLNKATLYMYYVFAVYYVLKKTLFKLAFFDSLLLFQMSTIKAPFGIVDMGSNGIRFGIVSALARHLPVAYEERAPIALLDAQGDERIIPEDVMDQVITSFKRFKSLCQDANVELEQIHVIATEATRVAINSKEFLNRIYETTGLTVSLLTKQQEALISASGIVGKCKRSNIQSFFLMSLQDRFTVSMD